MKHCRLAALFALVAAPALAQDAYPSRPITMIVPFPPGGVADLTARVLAPAMERVLRQPVVIQNRPGAAGATGAQAAANARADGCTVLITGVGISAVPEVDRLFGRQPVYTLDQFIGIARLNADPPMLVAHSSIPSRNLKQFVALAKSHPGELVYSSSGIYGPSHTPFEMFLHAAGLKMRHVPTTGGGQAMTAVLGGHATSWASPPAVAGPHLKAGKINAFATWGARRLVEFPGVPTFREQGYDIEYYLWIGFFAPRNVPGGVLKTLGDATRQAVQDPEFKKGMDRIQTPIAYQDAAEFNAWWEQDAAKLAAVIRRIGKVDAK